MDKIKFKMHYKFDDDFYGCPSCVHRDVGGDRFPCSECSVNNQ